MAPLFWLCFYSGLFHIIRFTTALVVGHPGLFRETEEITSHKKGGDTLTTHYVQAEVGLSRSYIVSTEYKGRMSFRFSSSISIYARKQKYGAILYVW